MPRSRPGGFPGPDSSSMRAGLPRPAASLPPASGTDIDRLVETVAKGCADLHHRGGRVDTWRKTKCWTESTLVLIGTEIDKRSGAPVALLARQSEEGLRYAGRSL